MVSYGLLSGRPCMIRPQRTIFEGITLTGFWVSKYLASCSRAERETLYGELAPLVLDGTVSTPIEATYPIEEAVAAIEHAARFRRSGKIMIMPNV
jgi:NADPH:quinone reductase-like Zn-dependent oxidoreductase